ncbi:MarR family winged helix-turn-helix transcriptional regulator [Actinoallomurus rhizosphaericola]|uniref:MarR family winged helix-turn-helix transcriptional regulator n=1 Tax=Actinoallomurus rhizosphaericola TaxID=2952536 RepID=UPI002093DAE5|nr:MarR family transcriptional regulator [Actinoallomurus rhizosphaericola]MCO5997555.1 MarR family transcriptional regulator [Actinoallomurus rhizosphaericola]
MTSATSTASGEALLDEHRDGPGLMLALLGHEAMRRLRDAHTSNGLTPRQFHILGLLHDHGPLAQTDLAVQTDTAASVLVTQLNPLETDGLVTRTRDPRDRRRHLVVLTEAGRQRLQAAAVAQQEVEDHLFRTLTDAQRSQLTQLLVLVRDDLTGGNEHCATPTSLDRKTS